MECFDKKSLKIWVMPNDLTKIFLKYGWVGAITTPILKISLGKNDVTGYVMTSSNIYPRKVIMNVVLMFGSSLLTF